MPYAPKKPILWFDMDGVMAKYDYDKFLAKTPGGTPLYLTRGEHFFLDMEPDANIIRAFERLSHEGQTFRTHYTRVLSSIPSGLLQAEHTLDKLAWCQKNVSGFRTEDFFCVSVPKHSAVAYDLWQLTEQDILIDDYNPNLYNWKEHGGTAIKCVNGINSINPDFDYIKTDWTPDEIINRLHSVMANRQTRTSEFGQFLHSIRLTHNESLFDMGQKLNVSSMILSDAERGRNRLPHKCREILIRDYGVTEDDLRFYNTCFLTDWS